MQSVPDPEPYTALQSALLLFKWHEKNFVIHGFMVPLLMGHVCFPPWRFAYTLYFDWASWNCSNIRLGGLLESSFVPVTYIAGTVTSELFLAPCEHTTAPTPITC